MHEGLLTGATKRLLHEDKETGTQGPAKKALQEIHVTRAWLGSNATLESGDLESELVKAALPPSLPQFQAPRAGILAEGKWETTS